MKDWMQGTPASQVCQWCNRVRVRARYCYVVDTGRSVLATGGHVTPESALVCTVCDGSVFAAVGPAVDQ